MTSRTVGIGMLGTGFIGEFHTWGLRYVRDLRLAACYGRDEARRTRFQEQLGYANAYDSIDAVCADEEVDLVVVSLPNHLHVEAVKAAARHGKGVVCTKPLARTADEAAEMLRAVDSAGVWAGYLENVVFSAELMRMREMVEAGAVGRPVTFRAREAHSGPHAAHFWDANLAGGGATLVHQQKTTGEDNAIVIVRFEDGRAATMDVSWSSKGGLEGRFELAASGGRIISDMASTPLKAFIEQPAGYLGEKTDADTGWVFPVPNETYVHGHDAMMGHMVEAFRAGREPRETFHDGFVVNAVLDAAYRSLKSGSWEPVLDHPAAVTTA